MKILQKLMMIYPTYPHNINSIYQKRKLLKNDVDQIKLEISKRESDIVNLVNIGGKKEQIKTLQQKIDNTKKEIFELTKREKHLGANFDANSNVEKRYSSGTI